MIRKLTMTMLSVAVFGIVVGRAHASVLNWTVQQSSSTLTISGALSSGGTFLANLQGQSGATGGLTTNFTGDILTQHSGLPASQILFEPGNLIDIQFLSANLSANNSGNWDPLPGGTTGTAAANYGARVSLDFLGGANLAIRDLAAGLTSGVIPLAGVPPYTTQPFAGDIELTLLSAIADYRGFGVVGGALGRGSLTDGIAGQSGTVFSEGTIAYGTGEFISLATLTLPIDFTFAAIVSGADTTELEDDIGVYVNLMGQIIGTTQMPIPEANSLVLLGLATSVVGFMGYRRTKISPRAQ